METEWVPLGEAAKRVGRSKTVLSKALSSGKLIRKRRHNNHRVDLDMAEVLAVFPIRATLPKPQETLGKTLPSVGDNEDNVGETFARRALEIEAVTAELAAAKAQVAMLEKILETVEHQHALLTGQIRGERDRLAVKLDEAEGERRDALAAIDTLRVQHAAEVRQLLERLAQAESRGFFARLFRR